MNWLSENYEWLFDDVAGAAAIALIVWLLQRLRCHKSAKTPNADQSSVNKIAAAGNNPTRLRPNSWNSPAG